MGHLPLADKVQALRVAGQSLGPVAAKQAAPCYGLRPQWSTAFLQWTAFLADACSLRPAHYGLPAPSRLHVSPLVCEGGKHDGQEADAAGGRPWQPARRDGRGWRPGPCWLSAASPVRCRRGLAACRMQRGSHSLFERQTPLPTSVSAICRAARLALRASLAAASLASRSAKIASPRPSSLSWGVMYPMAL